MREIGPIPDPEHMSAAHVGRVFGVSAQAVLAWEKRGCPRHRDKSFHLGQVVAWQLQKIQEAADEDSAKGERSKELERLRKHKANIAEIEEARMRGELVSAALVESDIGTAVDMFRSALMGLPQTLAARLEGLTAPQIAAELDEQMREHLGALKEELEKAGKQDVAEEEVA